RHKGLVEEVTRVQGAITKKLESRAVQSVAARLGNNRDLRAGAFAIFRRVGIGLDVKLADRVDTEQLPAHASRSDAQLAGTCVLNTIEQKEVFRGSPARDRERISVAGAGLGSLHGAVVDGPRIQRDQVIEAAAI